MRYKAIFWDADGVVLKSSRLFSEQLEIDYGIKTEILQPFFTGIFKQCSIGKADLKEELSKVIGEWGWKGTVEELMEYWFTKGTQVDQAVLDYVQMIRDTDVRCFMTTDQEKYRGKYLQNLLGSRKPFERVFYSGQIGAVKKDPTYYEHVYDAVNQASRAPFSELIAKENILVIDDGDKNIETANGLGFETHFFTDLESLKRFLAE
jgi:putative hydrolase of the HAD superfamily